MTPDSFDQYGQSLSGNFNSYHPPIMAILWSIFHKIYVGPQTMLFFHLSCLWMGIAFLYYSDEKNKYRNLYLFLPFLPNIFGQSTMIWKDVGFGNSLFLSLSIGAYYVIRSKKPSLLVTAFLLLIAFYACSVKFQAQYLIPLVIWFIVSLRVKNIFYKIIATCSISLIFLLSQKILIKTLSFESPSQQHRQFFDLASIVVDTEDDSVLPDYIKNNDRYSFKRLKEKFTHKSQDPMVYGEDRIYDYSTNPRDVTELEKVFFKAVLNHPFLYLKHRICNFSYIMIQYFRPWEYSVMDKGLAEKNGFNFKSHYAQEQTIKLLRLCPKFLSANLISFILIIVYSIYSLKNLPSRNAYDSLIFIYSSICLLYSFTMFLTTLSCDYRYYYVARLISISSIPIYLRALSLKRGGD